MIFVSEKNLLELEKTKSIILFDLFKFDFLLILTNPFLSSKFDLLELFFKNNFSNRVINPE